jgi:hypothetical protein
MGGTDRAQLRGPRAVVAELDREALRRRRPVTQALAGEIRPLLTRGGIGQTFVKGKSQISCVTGCVIGLLRMLSTMRQSARGTNG